jgi:hypothetical protein
MYMPIVTKKAKKSQFCKLKKHSRRRLHRRHSSRRYGGSLRKKLHSKRNRRRIHGGGIIPSSITQIGYSVMGAGQSMADGWNGKSPSFSSVNPSAENQQPVDGGMYQANHGIL